MKTKRIRYGDGEIPFGYGGNGGGYGPFMDRVAVDCDREGNYGHRLSHFPALSEFPYEDVHSIEVLLSTLQTTDNYMSNKTRKAAASAAGNETTREIINAYTGEPAKITDPAAEAVKQIIVVEERWVFMGYVRPSRTGTHLVIEECQNIRIWGTTAGLGQIALTGPTPETVLDPYGTIAIPMSKVLYVIDCEV